MNFPAVTLQLDRPRRFQFSPAACERFRLAAGFEIVEFESRTRAEPETFMETAALAIWAGLSDQDRTELTPSQVGEFMTLERLLLWLPALKRSMQAPNRPYRN